VVYLCCVWGFNKISSSSGNLVKMGRFRDGKDYKALFKSFSSSISNHASDLGTRITSWEIPNPITAIKSLLSGNNGIGETTDQITPPEEPLEEKIEPEYTPMKRLDDFVHALQDNGVITSRHREAYREVGYLVMALAYRKPSFEIGPLEELAVSYVAPTFSAAVAGGKGGSGKSLMLQALLFGLNNDGLSSTLVDLDPDDNGKGYLMNVVEDEEEGDENNDIASYVRMALGKNVVFEDGSYKEWVRDILDATGLNIFDFKRGIVDKPNMFICPGSFDHEDTRMQERESQDVLSQLFPFFASQIPTDVMGMDLPAGEDPSTIERWNSASYKFLVMDMSNEGAWVDATKFLKVATRRYITSEIDKIEHIINYGIKSPKLGRKPINGKSSAYGDYEALKRGEDVSNGTSDIFGKLINFGKTLAERVDYDSDNRQRYQLGLEDIKELRTLLKRTVDSPKNNPDAIRINEIYDNTDNKQIISFLGYTLLRFGNSISVIGNKVTPGKEEAANRLLGKLGSVATRELGFKLTFTRMVNYATDLFKYLSDKKEPLFYDMDDKNIRKDPLSKFVIESLTMIKERVGNVLDRYRANTIVKYLGRG